MNIQIQRQKLESFGDQLLIVSHWTDSHFTTLGNTPELANLGNMQHLFVWDADRQTGAIYCFTAQIPTSQGLETPFTSPTVGKRNWMTWHRLFYLARSVTIDREATVREEQEPESNNKYFSVRCGCLHPWATCLLHHGSILVFCSILCETPACNPILVIT